VAGPTDPQVDSSLRCISNISSTWIRRFDSVTVGFHLRHIIGAGSEKRGACGVRLIGEFPHSYRNPVGQREHCHGPRRLRRIRTRVDADNQFRAQKVRPVGGVHKRPAAFPVYPRHALCHQRRNRGVLKLRGPRGHHQSGLPVERVAESPTGISDPSRRQSSRQILQTIIVILRRKYYLVVEAAEIGGERRGGRSVDVDGAPSANRTGRLFIASLLGQTLKPARSSAA